MSEQTLFLGFSQAAAIELKLTTSHLVILRWITDNIVSNRFDIRLVNGYRCFIYGGGLYAEILHDLPILNIKPTTLSKIIFARLADAGVLIREIEHYGNGTNTGFRFGENYHKLFLIPCVAPQNAPQRKQEQNAGQNTNQNACEQISPEINMSGQNFDYGKAATIQKIGGC